MSTTVAAPATAQTTPSPVTAPISPISTAHAVKLARGNKRLFGTSAQRKDRLRSRHRMQRAARIFRGTMTLRDKVATYPDKGWAALILIGVGFVFTAVGYALALVAEALLS